MTFEIGLLLLIVAIALVLFSMERLPADVIALGVLLLLAVTGLLPAEQAFAGFGSDAVVMILGLLIMTAALLRTGVVEVAGREIVRRTGDNGGKLLIMIMVAAALLSSFISNTAATAFFIPVVIGIARRTKISASRLLMPLAFASILASSVTLVATSTNIVVSGLMTQFGLAPIGMFELTLVGLPIAVVGILYMYFLGPRMVPDRVGEDDLSSEVAAGAYLTEAIVQPNSPLAGKTLAESGLGRDLDLTVVRVMRGGDSYLAPQADLRLEGGDELLLEGPRDEILKLKTTVGLDLEADKVLADPTFLAENIRLVEAILLNRSPLLGRTLRDLQFRERFGLQVLAINRHGENILRRISEVPLLLGDILLIQGDQSNVAALEADSTIRILHSIDDKLPNLRRAPIAILAFVGALALATLNVVTLPLAIFLGVFTVFITGCITPEEAYREVDWKAIILVASMLGLGGALNHTGAADFLAAQIVQRFGLMDPIWLLSAFFVLTMLLTQPMSNQAAAVVVVPIALQTATQLGLNPRTFAIMIAVGASCSYLTPLEPSCLMVYGPGRYRFFDFIKVGSLLTVFIYLIAILIVPALWPLS